MNTSAKGAAYEAGFRKQYEESRVDARTKVYWQPPKPRQHSTGFDSMAWTIRWDDEGDLVWATEPTLFEFKAGILSCAAAKRLQARLYGFRPSFCTVAVVHKTNGKEYCEH